MSGIRYPCAPGVSTRLGSGTLAGEAGTIELVRNHLVQERGWTRRDILTEPFWAPGKTGIE